MPHLSETEILRFLAQVGALLIVSRALGDLMKRIGQAPVVGELAAGLLLGPSILGLAAPGVYQAVFMGGHGGLLEAFAWIGAILLLLYIGLETDLGILSGMGRTVAMVSGFGVAIPFAAGFALGMLLPVHYMTGPGDRLIFSLFIAVAISISAVPVIAKILIDLGIMRRELGLVILASGIVDDTTGWLLLSLVAGLAERGVIDFTSIALLLVEAGAFVALCYFVGFAAVARILRWVDDRSYIEHGKFTAMVALALVLAIITQAIGIHAVFGAFIAGVLLAGSARVRQDDRDDLSALSMGFMGPVFFAYSGLRADLTTLRDPLVLIIVLAVGCLTKLVGCGVGGRVGGLKWREALTVALGMNARGGMGIIVALIGLSLGVLTPQMYTVLLMLALITSLITPPLLNWSLGGVEPRPAEIERMEREKILARIPFSREGAKLLVLSGGGPNADLAAHLAAALGSHREASITVFRALRGDGEHVREFDRQFANIKSIAELGGARNVIQRSGSADSAAEAIVEEQARGYDAIFAGASQLSARAGLGGEVLRAMVTAARAPVVIARSSGAPMPFRRVLAPVTGASFSRLGATVAMLYALGTGARVTALYVRESSPLGRLYPGRRAPAAGEEFVEEIRLFGEQLGVQVETLVNQGTRPENVILRTAAEGDFDLLLMGVLFRSAEQRLYFGPKVEQILAKARCAVAVVVPPEPSFMRG